MKKIFYPLVFVFTAIIAGCTGRIQTENKIDCNVDPDEYFGQSYQAQDFQFWRVLAVGETYANIIDSIKYKLGERADEDAYTQSGSRLVPVSDTAAFGEVLRQMTLKFADEMPGHYCWLKDEFTGDYCELLFLYGEAEGRPLSTEVISIRPVSLNGADKCRWILFSTKKERRCSVNSPPKQSEKDWP